MIGPFFDFGLTAVIAVAAAGIVLVLRPRTFGPASDRWLLPATVAIAVTWSAVFTTLSILDHNAFNTHAYDLAIYDQVVWNTSQGRLFENSIMHFLPHFLGDHFSPALIVLAPLYWIWPDARVLLIVQAVALGATALPISLLASARLKSAAAGPIFALAFLLHPGTIFTVLFDFHDIVFAPPLVALSLLFLAQGRIRPFVATLLPILLIKEEMSIVVAAVGAWTAVFTPYRRVGLGLLVAGYAWFMLVVTVFIPQFNPEGQFYYLRRYFDAGEPGGGTSASLDKVVGLITRLLTIEKVAYLGHLLLPLGLLPLSGAASLMALPTVGYHLLSPEFSFDFITKHYSVLVLPFLTIGAIGGLARIADRRPALFPGALAGLLVATLASYYFQSPGPLARAFEPRKYQTDARAAVIREAIALIPRDASVMAQTDLVPHVAHRRTVYMFPDAPTYDGVDYVLLDLAGNKYPLTSPEDDYDRALQQYTLHPGFEAILDRENVLLLKKRPPIEPAVRLDAVFNRRIGLDGYTLDRTTVRPGEMLTTTLWWRAIEKPVEDAVLFVHLLDDTGQRRAQIDVHPTEDWYPTSMWEPGRRFTAGYPLEIPANLSPGSYRLVLGLYGQYSNRRLTLTAGGSGDVVVINELIRVVGR